MWARPSYVIILWHWKVFTPRAGWQNWDDAIWAKALIITPVCFLRDPTGKWFVKVLWWKSVGTEGHLSPAAGVVIWAAAAPTSMHYSIRCCHECDSTNTIVSVSSDVQGLSTFQCVFSSLLHSQWRCLLQRQYVWKSAGNHRRF